MARDWLGIDRWRFLVFVSIFVNKLIDTLWRQNPSEKVVIFATYLGTVDMIAREIEQTFPGQGVAVLRGGDHGAKAAAERRFRLKDGPRVLVCTAAGREGINLQFARVLFNFDLPWNPMDMEQRIGRIHRYGQSHTAQVYNLVLSDTIEGRIFLLLDEKLIEIARILLVPAEFSDAEHASDYRIHLTDADGPEVGAGWKRTGERAGEYIAVALDDPAFAQPIRANLFRAGGERAVWVLTVARIISAFPIWMRPVMVVWGRSWSFVPSMTGRGSVVLRWLFVLTCRSRIR